MPSNTTTPAPACTAWCDQTHDGWTEHPAATTKTCRRTIHIIGQQVAAAIILERFATREGPAVIVDNPIIRFDCPDALTLADAHLFADALTRASEMADPAAVAA